MVVAAVIGSGVGLSLHAGASVQEERPTQGTKAAAGTATVTVDGTTWTAKANKKGGCSLGKKVGGVRLNIRSFTGTDGTVNVRITVNPADPTTSFAEVRAPALGSDPHWEGGVGSKGDVVVKKRTTSGTMSFVSPIKDAEAVAARQDPRSYPGTFSFTC